VTPEQLHVTIFATQASAINQELLNAIPKIFSKDGEDPSQEYNITEISENLRVAEVGCVKMCAKVDAIVNNLN
jgi:hypothetical protein